MSSSTEKKVPLWSDQYRIGNDEVCSSRVALLKIIIRESHLDTNGLS